MSEREAVLTVMMDGVLEGNTAHVKALRESLGALSPLEELLGKTLLSVTQNGTDSIDFEAITGERWRMYHESDCCESCDIEDVIGDLQDLVGVPIAMVEESTNSDTPRDDNTPDSFTWTFYKFATVKGYVTIRWYGTSNGYYSETATFRRISP